MFITFANWLLNVCELTSTRLWTDQRCLRNNRWRNDRHWLNFFSQARRELVCHTAVFSVVTQRSSPLVWRSIAWRHWKRLCSRLGASARSIFCVFYGKSKRESESWGQLPEPEMRSEGLCRKRSKARVAKTRILAERGLAWFRCSNTLTYGFSSKR